MSRSVRATLASAVLIGICAVAGSIFGSNAQAAADTRDVHLKRYSEILAAIEGNYVEEIDPGKPVASSIREMLRTLDPHSSFFEVKEFSTLQERQKGSYFGLGITIVNIEGRITVVSPFEGSPAHRLGIRAGDIIVGIEAEDARGMDIDAVVKRLRELSDLLVVTGAARHPGSAWEYVLATAVGSVIGCQIAYEVARRGGEKLATRIISPARLLKAEMLLTKYGFFAIAIPALSPPPMPFKAFVLAAGIFAMPRLQFAATIFLARGLRYVIWSLLGAIYGDEAIGWVEHFDVWAKDHPVIVIGVLAVMFFGFVWWWKSHHVPPAEVEGG